MVEVEPEIYIETVRTFKGAHPTKPLMVFVHGFPEFWFSWRHQIAAFRSQYDIVAVSMRGYGLSSKPKGKQNYSLSKLSRDIAQVTRSVLAGAESTTTTTNGKQPHDNKNIHKAILIGHDWGGAVCWATAHRAPHLYSHVVIACAPHPNCAIKNMDFNQFLRSWYMFFFQLPWLPNIAVKQNNYETFDIAFLRAPMGVRRQGAISQDELSLYKKEFSRPGVVEAALNYYRSAVDRAAWGDWEDEELRGGLRKRLPMPTLCVWADKDTALGPQLTRGMEEWFEGKFVLKMMEDCSHWVQQDRPEEFNAVVKEFLES